MPARFEDVSSDSRRGVPMDLGGCYAGRHIQDDIVIAGFSARLPESSSVDEFKKNLFEGIDMVDDKATRWPNGIYDLPSRIGKIKTEDLENFDAQFFSVSQKQADCMDPQLRLLLETTHEAIVDAGLNPQDLRGSRTGVYVGVSSSESEQYWSDDPDRVNGYGLTGCSKAMFANRLSFNFDFKGPSFAIDTACSSSLYALTQAFNDIRAGVCDSAIVSGANLLLRPTLSLQFKRLGMLSADGACKAFDESGKGYVRSDGIVSLFLQKASDAKRFYASILNAKTNTDGAKEKGITFPNGQMQNRLIRETYEEININPADVSYVEAHGTGTKAGDPEEVNSICDFFCKDRKTPLLIGSVKSNMGHSEPASGVCSIAKLLIAMEEGMIPMNLHYKTPNPDLYGILDGRIKVVDKNTPWTGGIMSLNSFGFGGANAHVVLKSNPKPKPVSPKEDFLRLVVVSGRTEEAVEMLLDDLEKHKEDEEYIGLVNEVHSKSIPLHYYRGYTVLTPKDSTREIADAHENQRPIWYIYSGMGCQWASMAKDLMQIDVFNNTIHRCAEALRPEGIDLIEILTKSTDATMDNIMYSFLSIAAVQIALTDVLTHLGISPDGIVGHSVGELGCAYADGCFTVEQTILSAYSRGKSIIDTELIRGQMAAVGLSWEECSKRLPKDVIAACHNSSDSVTISGPEDSVTKVIEELTAEGIFAKAVKSANIAFHSKYISDAGPKLRKSLDKIIPSPKNRTSRWISTSIPQCAQHTPMAKQSSAAYHVNNLLSPVLFHDAIKLIPNNAVCIEIAPHGLLQAILRRSLDKNCINLSLMKRMHENNIQFLLANIGKLYTAGSQPAVSKLYRPVSFPVGRGTPMLNSKIGWDHTVKHTVPSFHGSGEMGGAVVEINLEKEGDEYLAGHTIDGRILFPATGYLSLAWRTYAKTQNTSIEKMPVIFEDVVFHRATILPKQGSVKLSLSFFGGSGAFEICESGSLAVSGRISLPQDVNQEMSNLDPLKSDKHCGLELETNDIYKELRLRGYDYRGIFKGLNRSDPKADVGYLKWENNWVSYMDTMLQFAILGKDMRELYLPTRIEKVIINPMQHLETIEKCSKTKLELPVYMYKYLNVIKSGGVEMRGLKASLAPRKSGSQSKPTLEKYVFVPNINLTELSEKQPLSRQHAITALAQLVIENSSGALKMKVIEAAFDRSSENVMAQQLVDVIEGEPTLTCEMIVATNDQTEMFALAFSDTGIKVVVKDMNGTLEQNCHLAVGYDIFGKANGAEALVALRKSIKDDGFILIEECAVSYNRAQKGVELFKSHKLSCVASQICENHVFVLLRPTVDISERKNQIINVTENNFAWLRSLQDALKSSETNNEYVYIVCQGEELVGAVGLMNCIKNENGGKNCRLVFIQEKVTPKFSFDLPLYADQLKKDLIMNVYNRVWGTFRHLKLDSQSDVPSLQVEHAYVNALSKGDLASLKWIEGPLSRDSCSTKDSSLEMCTVYYAPINFRDVMLSSGKLGADALPGDLAKQDCILGLEFSGRDSNGKRIMAMVAAKSLATTCLATRKMIWEIPDSWSMEQASTVPCVYSTVYYALVCRGRMKAGESILIHAGSGGVGQAAISVALHGGLKVFTTVGSKEKRDFLKKKFPKLTDKQIGNSRDCTFEQLIMTETHGKGVDLVLNSLAEEKLLASVRCLGLNGRFLEIGKFDLSNNSPLGMSVFLKNTSFHGILLDSVMEGDDATINEVVSLVAEGMANGAVRPLQTSVFTDQQVEQAFRFMASGKHIGKVVIKVRDEEKQRVLIPTPKLMTSLPRTYMHNEKVYILIGGLGGFGLELANWLVSRGATKIMLTSRSGIKTGYQSLMVRRWQSVGVHVVIDTNDVTTAKGAEKLIKAANKIGSVGGIFNLAAVLRDNIIENLTETDYKSVCTPKIDGTKHLDFVSRQYCPDLDYFVCFSSVSCGRGNIGQSNYGLANSAMERISESRRAAGLPATAIQWGAIGDTGLVIENLGDNETVIGGTLPQRMISCLQTMDLFLQQPHPVLASMVVAENRKSDNATGISLTGSIANILGIKDVKNIHDTATLVDLGMDSLMGSEVKQTLERNYDLVMNPQEIRLLTFGQLRNIESGETHASPPSPARNVSVDPVGDGTQVEFTTELMPDTCLVRLLSAMDSTSTTIQPLFIVSAIEGVVSALKPLAAKMNCPVWGLQFTADVPLTSIQDVAKYYMRQIKTVQPKGPYNMCGYSFGACIAFEMVHQLELAGEQANLIMLDGAPKYVSWFTDIHKKADEKGNEAFGLAYFAMLIGKLDFLKTGNILQKLSSWDVKVKACAEMIHAVTKHPRHLLEITATTFYHKLLIAHTYNPNYQIKGKVILFKPTDNFTKLAEDYGLSEVCSTKVSVLTVEGDHRTFLTGSSVPHIASTIQTFVA